MTTGFGPRAGVVGRYRASADLALGLIGDLAEAIVPSGILLRWGADLDWPIWMCDGSSYRHPTELPKKIRLADDLVLSANLLDKFGAAALLESIIGDVYAAAGKSALAVYTAAPTGIALLQFLTKAINLQNPQMRMRCGKEKERYTFDITALPELGLVGRFMEHGAAMTVLRLIASFQPRLRKLSSGRTSWPTVALGDADAETIAQLNSMDAMVLSSTDGETHASIPASFLDAPNTMHDPVLWEQAYADLRKNWMSEKNPITIESLRLHIRKSLTTAHRAPDLDALSCDLAISKRTINRKLSTLEMSFQNLIIEEKMRLARNWLATNERTVEHIAQSLGYSTGASFSRAFRQVHGMAPGEWQTSGVIASLHRAPANHVPQGVA